MARQRFTLVPAAMLLLGLVPLGPSHAYPFFRVRRPVLESFTQPCGDATLAAIANLVSCT